MKKSQFAILITVIILGLGGVFGYVKYRLDKQEVDNNKTEEKEISSEEEKSENSNYSISEIEKKISSLADPSEPTALMKKYDLTRALSLKNDNYGISGFYKSNKGLEMEPSDDYLNIVGFTDQQKAIEEYTKALNDGSIYDYFSTMDNEYDLKEMADVETGEEYLLIIFHPYMNYTVYIYDKYKNVIGNFITMAGGLYYPNDLERNILKNNEKIELHENYILSLEALDSTNTKFAIVKYTVDNGKLNRTIDYTFADGEVECAQCK